MTKKSLEEIKTMSVKEYIDYEFTLRSKSYGKPLTKEGRKEKNQRAKKKKEETKRKKEQQLIQQKKDSGKGKEPAQPRTSSRKRKEREDF
ncbi:unnamed protein product [Mucor hiemalis]